MHGVDALPFVDFIDIEEIDLLLVSSSTTLFLNCWLNAFDPYEGFVLKIRMYRSEDPKRYIRIFGARN